MAAVRACPWTYRAGEAAVTQLRRSMPAGFLEALSLYNCSEAGRLVPKGSERRIFSRKCQLKLTVFQPRNPTCCVHGRGAAAGFARARLRPRPRHATRAEPRPPGRDQPLPLAARITGRPQTGGADP